MSYYFEDFYKQVERDYGDVRLSKDSCDAILREFVPWFAEQLADKEEKSSSEGLWQIAITLREAGYEPFGEQTMTSFIANMIESLKEAQVELAAYVNDELSTPVDKPGFPVAEDRTYYKLEHERYDTVLITAEQTKNQDARLTRVFLHDHQPGEACTTRCEEMK